MRTRIGFTAAVALLLAVCSAAVAQTSGVHLTWSANRTSTSTTVAWMSRDSFESRVEYGTTASMARSARSYPFYSAVCDLYVHEVRLVDLPPGRKHFYRCRVGEDWTPRLSFRTAPGSGSRAPFRFAVYGDTRTNLAERVLVRDAIMRAAPDFVLHVGDLVDWGGHQLNWDIWFAQMETLASRCQLMPAIGNHEVYGGIGNYLDQYALPTASGTEEYYSFDYGNMHVAALSMPHDESSLTDDPAQLRWLAEDLQRAGADSSITWKVVFFHVSPYSTAMNNLRLRREVSPILEELDVDICFTGHTHNYERSFMLRDGVVVDSGPRYSKQPGRGTLYIVAGGGCAPLHHAPYGWWTARALESYSFCLVEVNGCTLSVRVLDEQSREIDKWTMERASTVFEVKAPALAQRFKLHPVLPNPARDVAAVQVDVPADTRVEVAVYSTAGKLVRLLTSGLQPRGSMRLVWDGTDSRGRRVASGTYLVRLLAPGFQDVRSVIIAP